MSDPAPELFDLLVGRRIDGRPIGGADGLVESADEHRLTGLLLAAVEAGWAELERAEQSKLTALHLTTEAHHRRLWSVIADLVDGLAEIGIEAAVLKGVANERRWFDKVGERPSGDIDLLIAPHHVDRIDEVLASYGVDHPAPTEATDLARRRLLQHVHFEYRGVVIDVHLDPLKLGVPAATAAEIWASTTAVPRPDGGTVRVLGTESALVAALTHLNKDRFAYLGAYEEIRRIANDPDLDWGLVGKLVEGEGLDPVAWCCLDAVADALPLDRRWPAAAGWRARAWQRVWPAASRLGGHHGRTESPSKQKMLPFLMAGRRADAWTEWRRFVVPPEGLLDIHRPETRGQPYLRRITVDRIR